jgi:neutral amino acid transport system permease protein
VGRSAFPTRLAALVLAVLVGLGVVALGGPASAGIAEKVTGSGSQCGTSTAKTGCVLGSVVDENNTPVKDVKISISGPAGSATVNTGATGQFSFVVDQPGTYKVSLDTSTLPSGVKLASASAATLTATVSKSGIFPSFGDGASPARASYKLTGHITGSSSYQTGSSSRWHLAWQQFAQGLLLGLLLALAAIGLSLIYGTTGLSNFAHSEQITLGGFLAYVLAYKAGLNIIIATVLVVALTALSGYLQDTLLWKPLRGRGLGLNQLMVVTIGLSLALEYVFQYIWGGTVHPVATSLQHNVGIFDITPRAYWSMLVSIVVLVVVGLALLFTRLGRATRAVADNRALAAASGIDVDRIIRIVWTVSTALAGLAGVLYALVNGGVYWLTGAQLLLLVFAAVTLGGIGTAFGALVGSLIIGVVAAMSTLWIPQDLEYATGLVILIVILLVRPQGILGRKERVG